MSEKTPFQQVEEFHKIFDPHSPDVPTAFSKQAAIYRAEFKIEELVELIRPIVREIRNNYTKE